MYTFTHLLTPSNVSSGIADFILLAPVSDFEPDGIKCPVAPFTLKGDRVKIKTAHTFLTGKGFIKLICAPEKNQINAKTIGDKGFNKLDLEYDFFVPGSYADLHEQMAELLNIPLIVLTKDSNCGSEIWYQLGCDCIYAYISIDFSTGTNKDGVKGYSGKVSYQAASMLLYAAGEPELLVEG